MKSTVLICPAEHAPAGDLFFHLIGMAEKDDRSLTVELSSDGKPPATHLGCHARFQADLTDKGSVRETYVQTLRGHPSFDAMDAWGAAVHVAQQPEKGELRPSKFFDQQIAALGLQRIVEEET